MTSDGCFRRIWSGPQVWSVLLWSSAAATACATETPSNGDSRADSSVHGSSAAIASSAADESSADAASELAPSGPSSGHGGGDAPEAGVAAPTPASSNLADSNLVSLGERNLCLGDSSGEIQCKGGFGDNTEPPAGRFIALGAAGRWTCAAEEAGPVTCWSTRFTDDPVTLEGQYVQLTVGSGRFGDAFVCVLDTQQHASCHALEAGAPDLQAPSGEFVSLSAGGKHVCGSRPDQSVECWGHEFSGIPEGAVEEIACYETGCCALDPGGTVQCWDESFSLPALQYQSLGAHASTDHVCAVEVDGTTRCSYLGIEYAVPEQGSVEDPDLWVGPDYACRRNSEAGLSCWSIEGVAIEAP